MLESKIKNIINKTQSTVSVAVQNLNTNERILINENLKFPSASTIKLLILSEFFNQVNKNIIQENEKIYIKEEMITLGDGIIKELNLNHSFTLIELATLMIILSDNTATNILINKLGFKNINNYSSKINLKNTSLNRKMMDAKSLENNIDNYTCANDLLNLLYLTYKGNNVNSLYSQKFINIMKKQIITNRLDLHLPKDVFLAHKTGDLDNIEHDCGIIFSKSCDLIICILTKDNISNIEGQNLITDISNVIYKHYL